MLHSGSMAKRRQGERESTETLVDGLRMHGKKFLPGA
jgi:hypothetical protein